MHTKKKNHIEKVLPKLLPLFLSILPMLPNPTLETMLISWKLKSSWSFIFLFLQESSQISKEQSLMISHKIQLRNHSWGQTVKGQVPCWVNLSWDFFFFFPLYIFLTCLENYCQGSVEQCQIGQFTVTLNFWDKNIAKQWQKILGYLKAHLISQEESIVGYKRVFCQKVQKNNILRGSINAKRTFKQQSPWKIIWQMKVIKTFALIKKSKKKSHSIMR